MIPYILILQKNAVCFHMGSHTKGDLVKTDIVYVVRIMSEHIIKLYMVKANPIHHSLQLLMRYMIN